MNTLPQRPPSPPDSEKASCLTTDTRGSTVARVVGGRLIRQNEYFIPHDGINGDILAAELPFYLGNDASQRPGAYEDEQTGRLIQGYYITAYRNLTAAMMADIKADSAKREEERARPQTDCTTDQKIQQWRDGLHPPGGSI
ncbi:hypothetical protein KVR01_007316 [Diaporthe batatas]|uniref:uncharacterized protein n=1 Tax=Diaporthe batatas TaxID=748121 RepID=UPI001D039E14|nr:uncharacterized protein KVR01_007316 [Diaporthe batatas]KAG8162838.1 hypothetical protein KVR01_007316 [Diaporthe batatas]